MKLDKRLLRRAGGARRDLALTAGLGFVAGVVLVGQARLLSLTVGEVFLEGSTLAEVAAPLLALLALSLLRAVLVWGGEVAASRVAVQVKGELRQQLAAHLLALGPAYAQGERSGELVNTVVEGVEALDAYFRQYLPQLALAALVPLTVLFFVFPLDWLSGLVLLLTAPLIPIFMVLIGHTADAMTRRQWTTLSRLSAHFMDVLQGLATLKLFGRSRAQISIIAQVSDQFRGVTMGVLRVAFLSALVLELVATISTAVVAVQIGLRLLYGLLSFEQGFFVLLLAPEFYLPLRLLGARFHAGMAGVAAAARIWEVLDTKNTGSGIGHRASGVGHFDVCFDDVSFAYDGGQRVALKGTSLEIGAGERVALVGPSGAGKSTIAALLLRFVEPDDGAITVGGMPLRDLPAEAWREQVAWVPQQPHLFHGTVADNIRLARPEAALEDVERVARQAAAHEFVAALPQGYDTVVGERGARLSGGQAQRIALARAFLKDAPLLVLDEATANLDPETETAVQGALARLLAGRTALIIAHRLSTVSRADRIVVMDGGRVAEMGTRAELLARGGLYARLVGAHGEPAPGGQEGIVSPRSEAFGEQRGIAGEREERKGTASEREARGGELGRLLRLAAPFAPRMALAALLGFLTIGSGVGLMTTSGYLIAAAALQPSIADLQVAIVGVRFFGISRGLFRYLERYVSHDVTFRLLARLRVWFYRALEPLAPARLMHYRSGDLLARIVADVDTLENVYLRAIAPPVVALLVVLLATLLVGNFDPWLAVVLLAFLLLAGVGLPLLARVLAGPVGRRLVAVRAELNGTLADGILGVADLLAFGQEARHLAQIGALGRALGRLQVCMARIGGLHASAMGLLMNLATLAVLAVAVPLVNEGTLDGVYLAPLMLAAIASFEAVLPLPQAFQYLDNSLAAAGRLFEIVDAEPAVVDPPAAKTSEFVRADSRAGGPAHEFQSLEPKSLGLDLQVQDLHFAYEPGGPPALDGVSFHLPAGGCLAVVGPSGAGKSTLGHLLLRFWDYQQGRILLAGRELRTYAPEDVRSQMAVVSQRTDLFTATVRENLRLALPAGTDPHAAGVCMVEAARQAQIHEFIESLPQGYDTWLGEQGQRLSGGQRQRLAIARAILKDAPLLLLDEPVAHLDALTEQEVMASLRRLMAGCTTLLITHRLVGLEVADEILVLRAGRVVERGRHEELVLAGGLYARLWALQNEVLA